jgi:hypothetical protein
MSDRRYVEGSERRQKIFLPDMLDECVTEDNPVRFIDAFVEKSARYFLTLYSTIRKIQGISTTIIEDRPLCIW